MPKETLKDWIKKWTLKQIICSASSDGMGFMANKISITELKRNQRIAVKEIRRRFNLNQKI